MARHATRSGSEAKKDGSEIPVLPVAKDVSQKSAPQPKIGMIVIYNNTPAHAQNVCIETPMVITKVHSDNLTVDGVMFNTHSTAGSLGSTSVYSVRHGNDLNRWFEISNG